MLAAKVNGLLTTFDYDGDGNRLRMSVAGEVTAYTLDYAGGFRVLLEEGGAFADTKHYLYGLECIAELVDAGEPESEWRFYQRDGSSLVRQTTNMQATVTLAWTYSPEGAVLLGEQGPVTNLDCSGNTIYDFSTGLIFKHGRYFDPNTGIWVTMSGLVIYQGGFQPYGRRRKWGRSKKRLILLSILLLLALLLAGCGTAPEQIECPTPGPALHPVTLTPTPLPPTVTLPSDPTSTPTPTLEPLYRLTTTNWEGNGLIRFGVGTWGTMNKEAVLLALDMVQVATDGSPNKIVELLTGTQATVPLVFNPVAGSQIGGAFDQQQGDIDLFGADQHTAYLSSIGLFLIIHEMGHGVDQSLGSNPADFNSFFTLEGGFNFVGWEQDAAGNWVYTGSTDFSGNGPANSYLTGPSEDFANSFASVVIAEVINKGRLTSLNGTNLDTLVRFIGDENGDGVIGVDEFNPVSDDRYNFIVETVFPQLQE